jgi:hypothetical protein
MGRTLNEIIASLPKTRRNRIDARYQLLKAEFEKRQTARKTRRGGKSISPRRGA